MSQQTVIKPSCFHCHTPLELPLGNVARSEQCPKCHSDVRVCFNCKHYDKQSYNECREPSAERVVEKGRANFCDYFHLGLGTGDNSSARENLRKNADDIFK